MIELRIIETISKDHFLKKWIESEKYNSNQNRRDQNSWDRIETFSNNKISTDLIEIDPDEEILSKLITPYHAGRNHFFKTGIGGNSLKEFMSKYSYQQAIQNENDICSQSILFHAKRFLNQKESGNSFVEGICIYITKNVKLSPDPNSRSGDYLYAGGFHQIAAYGLFVKEFGPIPLRLYLCNYAA